MADFPEIGSSWQKPVNEGTTIETRRVTRVVREEYPPNDRKSQYCWIYYQDGRGQLARAELGDWRRWIARATQVIDGTPVTEPEVVMAGTLE